MKIYLNEGVEHSDAAKRFLQKKLREQGYVTYARILGLFDVYLTDNPEVVGYMIPGKAKIVLNRNLSPEQVSVVVRHEILHEFLAHGKRGDTLEKALGKKNAELSNIAADFEISNRGYTPQDKAVSKRLRLGDRVVQGLVTELDRPGWENLSFEEMYEKLLDEMDENEDEMQQLLQKLADLSQKELEDLENALEQAAGEGQSDDSTQQSQAGKLADEVAKLADEVQGTSDPAKPNSKPGNPHRRDATESEGPFPTPEEQQRKLDIATRVQEIKDVFASSQELSEIERENRVARRAAKQKAAQAAQDANHRGRGLAQFKLDLRRFIADQLESEEVDSYARIHPSYEDSEFILPGRFERESKQVPTVSVYWDVSGSFDNPAKTEGARQAINTLNEYVRSGDIILNTFYHASKVASTAKAAGRWNSSNAVLQHIQDTKPDNVIVITDGDLRDANIPTQVPGAAWMLFYDDTSNGLIQNLTGKKQSRYYMVDYR